MTAFYNEIDPYAAQWLKNLIAAGHIAPGVVDTRSIEDINPEELLGFTQCHFFAGIGVWSHALRLAGWPDDRPVWTGSCPCQPFSAAGQGAGTADERHLWPAWFHLIDAVRPPVVFGEQVEAAIKHGWLDLVQDDLEGIGYTGGAIGFPAAGVGAPHIRQRLYFVADTLHPGRPARWTESGNGSLASSSSTDGMANNNTRREGNGLRQIQRGWEGTGEISCASGLRPVVLLADANGEQVDPSDPGRLYPQPISDCPPVLLAHHHHQGLEIGAIEPARPERQATERGGDVGRPVDNSLLGRYGSSDQALLTGRECPVVSGPDGELGDPSSESGERIAGSLFGAQESVDGAGQPVDGPVHLGPEYAGQGVVRSAYAPCEWLYCRDGKWRPTQPGLQPLAHGAPSRVGRLRAYGNAIVAPAAQAFISSYLEAVTLREMLQ